MVSTNDNGKGDIRNSVYLWYICDDINLDMGGNYFKVVRVDAKTTNLKLYNAYEIDIGFPSSNNVANFSVNQDDSWAILYDYSKNIQMPEYSYSINNKGEIVEDYSPVVTNSGKYFITTEAERTWWTQMTQFPIQATLTIQGLLKPAMLMTYVKLNVYFYSKKHDRSSTGRSRVMPFGVWTSTLSTALFVINDRAAALVAAVAHVPVVCPILSFLSLTKT